MIGGLRTSSRLLNTSKLRLKKVRPSTPYSFNYAWRISSLGGLDESTCLPFLDASGLPQQAAENLYRHIHPPTQLTALLNIGSLLLVCLPSSSSYLLYSANGSVLVSMIVVEAGRFPDINIVSLDWLRASIDGHVRADEAQFSLTQTNSSRSIATSSKGLAPSKQEETKGKGSKRPRSSTSIEDGPSDVVDSEAHVTAKRHKDGQTATSSSLLIPIDETCPLAGKTPDRKPFQCKS